MSDLLNQASLVMVPSGYKEDTVYSVVPSDGSGDLTFTRASNGTRVNSAGLVEVCPWNLLEYSEDLSNVAWVKYESTISANATTAPNGTTTADLLLDNSSSDAHSAYEIITASANTYTWSVYAKAQNNNFLIISAYTGSHNRTWFNLSNGTVGTNASGNTATIESVGNGWYRCSVSRDYVSGTLVLEVGTSKTNGVFSYTGNGTDGIYIWGAQLNIGSTAKPYFPTTDRLNVPRLTYQNGGGGCPSLLLEKQSTNLITYSEQFDNAAWQPIATSSATVPVVTANYTISPDGTQNADRVQFARTGTSDGVYSLLLSNTCNLTATGTYTMYVKSLTSSTQNLLVYWGGGQGSVFQVTTEWTRITLSNLSSANQPMLFGTRGGTGNYFSGGDLSIDIAVWGAQLEASSYPTSYIPTTSSSATRVADACFKTGISSLIGQTEGTLFVDINYNGENFGLTNNFYIYIGDGNNTDAIYIDQYDNKFRWVVFDGTTIRFYTDVAMTTGRHKLALAYKNNDYSAYLDGTLITTQTLVSGAVPTCSQFSLIGNVSNFDNNVKQINQAVLFPTRLTNAELAQLTA